MLTRIACVMMMAFAAISLSGCAPNLRAAFVYCEVEKPITWSRSDTDQTIREVKAHNAVYKSLCKTT